MDVIHHIAQAAAMLLLLELLVVVLILLAIAGGLGFGLRWVRGKLGWASDKANGYLRMGVKYLHMGTGYAAKPFIMASAWADRVRATASAIREQVRRGHPVQPAAPPPPSDVGARPVQPAEQPQEPVPLT